MPTDPILTILIMLASAFIAGQVLDHFRLPPVLGYLLAGLFLGLPTIPFTAGGSQPFIEFFIDIGLIVLFFFVGLGIKIDKIQNMKPSIYLGLFTSLLPFGLGAAAGLLMGQTLLASLVIGLAMSISAQAITVELLEDANILKKKFGQTIVGAGVVADVIQLLGLGLVFSLFPSVSATPITSLIGGWFALVAAIIALKVLVIPLILQLIPGDEEGTIAFFTGALVLALFMGFLGEVFGVGSILGAIFAGALIRYMFNTRVVRKLEKQLKLVAFGLFIPVFFVSLGMNVGLTGLTQNIELGLLLTALSIIGTLAAAVIVFTRRGSRWEEGMAAGWAFQSKGDVDLVVAAIAIELGAISMGVFDGLIIMSTVSMIVGPLAFFLTIRWMDEKGIKLK